MTKLSKYFYKNFAMPRLNIIEITLATFLLVTSILISYNSILFINATDSLSIDSNFKSLLISEDNSKAYPNESTVIFNPTQLNSDIKGELTLPASLSQNVSTVPYQDLTNKSWTVYNPFENSENYGLEYKISPYTILEIKYSSSAQQISFVLPSFDFKIENTSHSVPETVVATIDNIASDKYLYLSDYEGITLANYTNGHFISFQDVQNNKILIYSINNQNSSPDINPDLITSPINCSWSIREIVDIKNPMRCFGQNFKFNFNDDGVYLANFSLSSKNLNYAYYNFQLSDQESKLNSPNTGILQSIGKTKLLRNNALNYTQQISIKNPGMNYLQFSLSSVEDWQSLSAQINSLRISKLNFENIAKILPKYDSNLTAKINLRVQLPSGKNNIYTNNQRPKDFQVSSQNTNLNTCNFDNLLVSNYSVLRYNWLNLNQSELSLLEAETCLSLITDFIPNPDFFYNLEIDYNSEEAGLLNFSAKFPGSTNVISSDNSDIGLNSFETILDPANVKVAGTYLEIKKQNNSALTIQNLSITKGLPADLNNYVFAKENLVQNGFGSITKVTQNNILQSNFKVNSESLTNTDVYNLVVKSNSQADSVSLKSSISEDNVYQYEDTYRNKVWLINCLDVCTNSSFNVFNLNIFIQKISAVLAVIVILIYLLAKSYLLKNSTILKHQKLKILENTNLKYKSLIENSAKHVSIIRSKYVSRLVQNKLVLLLVLACIFLLAFFIFGLRITFFVTVLLTCLKFKVTPKILVLVGFIGIIIIYTMQFLILQLQGLNQLLDIVINASTSNFISTYSFYILVISIILYATQAIERKIR